MWTEIPTGFMQVCRTWRMPSVAMRACACALGAMAAGACAATCDDWPAYRGFVAHFVQRGRVVDDSTPTQQSTSEGQSYGMFFALVANDRATFDTLLGWTRTHLSAGQFDGDDVKLPSWQWGRTPEGLWGVIDKNSAADSDLWIAYDLFEAGRLWHEPGYTKLAYALSAQIEQHEIVELGGFGPMLMPGPQGFSDGRTTRLNPSYLPLPLLRSLSAQLGDGVWQRVAENAFRLIRTTAPLGFSPDWVAYRDGQFVVDPQNGGVGSYDAIRVYLWAGLIAPNDPLARPWLVALHGMRDRIARTGTLPEKIATTTGIATGEAPAGFWGALLPYFRALGDAGAVRRAEAHLGTISPGHAPPAYYDEVLILFGTGAAAGRYRFDENGHLVPHWENICQSGNVHS